MPTRTISNAGGNWNSIGTWVEGAVPTSSDDVVATATSGNLVLNATCDCATFDLTSYTGTITGTNNLRIFSTTFTLAGTINTTATLQFLNTAKTITANGLTWGGNVVFPSVQTMTIIGDFIVGGNLSISSGMINGNNILFAGNLSVGGNQTGTPTSVLIANGTGTQTWSGNFVLRQSLTINKATGTFVVSGSVNYAAGTLTYTTGTVTTTNSTLTISTLCTLNTDGISWYNITFGGTTTITNNSRLTVSNNLTYAASSVITFAGTEGWTAANFFILTSNNINHTLVAGKEYIITTYFESISTTNSLKYSLVSGTPGTKAIFTLNYGATQNVGYTNAVDIDSSRGQTIWTFNGVVTTTFNWNTFTSNGSNQKSYIM